MYLHCACCRDILPAKKLDDVAWVKDGKPACSEECYDALPTGQIFGLPSERHHPTTPLAFPGALR